MPDNYENQYAYDYDQLDSQKPKHITITSIVTRYYAVVLTVLLALIFLGLFFFFTRATDRVTERTVEDAVVQTANAIEFQETASSYQISIPPEFDFFIDGVSVLMFDQEGSFLAGSYPADFPASNASFRNDQHRLITVDDDTVYSVYERFINIGSEGIWIRGVYPLDSVNTLIRQSLSAVAILFPLVIVTIIIVGYFITRRSLKPLEALTKDLRNIEGSNDLSLRLSVPYGPRGQETELSTLTNSFNDLLERLEDGFRKEQQFTSDSSHELRTPIAAIMSQAEAGLLPNATPEDMEHSLRRVHAQAKNMNTLIMQLLELTRTDRGTATVNIERINFSELAEDVTYTLQDKADDYKITLQTSVEPDIYVHGDEILLMRLIINLASNGIKYGTENGFVTVDLRLDGDRALLNVSDNGIGIAQEDIDRIFDRFYRINSTRSKSQQGEYSSGLGLSMVNWVVKTHKGRIEVNSTPNVGSQFLVWLPLADTAQAPELGKLGGTGSGDASGTGTSTSTGTRTGTSSGTRTGTGTRTRNESTSDDSSANPSGQDYRRPK